MIVHVQVDCVDIEKHTAANIVSLVIICRMFEYSSCSQMVDSLL